MINDTKFILSAARLSRAAPAEWAEFLETYRRYSYEVINACISSPPEVPGLLPVLQGRAQQARELLDHLENAAARADKIESKKQNGRD